MVIHETVNACHVQQSDGAVPLLPLHAVDEQARMVGRRAISKVVSGHSAMSMVYFATDRPLLADVDRQTQ